MDETSLWPMVGLAFGTALGFAGAFGGAGALLLVLVLGIVGFIAGRAMTGQVDLSQLVGGERRRT